MNVGQICHRPAISIGAGAPLSEVAKLMNEHHVGAVVVTKSPIDQPVPVGIVTDRDIVRAQLEHAADLSRLGALEAMTRDPLVVNENDSIAHAIDRMRARGVRRAPVASPDGALVGLVSTDDLLAEVAGEIGNLAQIVASQPRQEPERKNG